MSGLLTADEMDVWHRWRGADPREFGRYFSRIDVESLVDHIALLTTVITDLADADDALTTVWRSIGATADVAQARLRVAQALSALHDVAKVIR